MVESDATAPPLEVAPEEQPPDVAATQQEPPAAAEGEGDHKRKLEAGTEANSAGEDAKRPRVEGDAQVDLSTAAPHCLRFSTPTVSGSALLDAVSALSRVPAGSLRLVTGRLSISPSSVLAPSPDGQFPSASALLRLRGGKGGFGSLLRGAASNPGQKKTSNFDACRDINGRRLRHVNAERRLEEWKAASRPAPSRSRVWWIQA